MRTRKNGDRVASVLFVTCLLLLFGCPWLKPPVLAKEEIPALEMDKIYRKACGPVNLYISFRMLGYVVPINELFGVSGMTEEGKTTFAGLSRAADHYELHTISLEGDTHFLKNLDMLALLHLKRKDLTHFVLFAGYKDGKYKIIDGTKISSGKPILFLSECDLKEVWTGKLMIISKIPIIISDSGCFFQKDLIGLLILLNLSSLLCFVRK